MSPLPPLPAVRRSSTVDTAAETLRVAIVDGLIGPGTRLVEAELTASLGISRNTLREVLRLLEAERLVRRTPHRGVEVRRLTAEEIADIYVVRKLVEVGAIREAASTPARVREQCVARMRAAFADAVAGFGEDDVHRMAHADIEFHRAVAALADSLRLVQVIERLTAELRLAFALMPDRLAFHERFARRNARICDLVERGDDAAAATALASYLADSQAELTGRLAP